MAKKPKKRNKPYTGADAKTQTPVVHRYQAVQRSKLGEWWHERKRIVKFIAIAVGAVGLLVWLVFEFLRIVF